MNDDKIKVVKIINEYMLVINVGTDDNFQIGDEFEIFEIGEQVFDEETNECLGTLDPIKAYIEIQNIYPKMAVCVNSKKQPHSPAMSVLVDITATMTSFTPQKLTVNVKDISGGLDDNRVISVGDRVRPKIG